MLLGSALTLAAGNFLFFCCQIEDQKSEKEAKALWQEFVVENQYFCKIF